MLLPYFRLIDALKIPYPPPPLFGAYLVRRSNGIWTYALVADGNDDEIRFVVDDRGCTKLLPKYLWKSHVRRIRVLTQRQGDRIAATSQPSCEMQINGRIQSFKWREKGSCAGKLPSTIME